jgi:hypothetical protein
LGRGDLRRCDRTCAGGLGALGRHHRPAVAFMRFPSHRKHLADMKLYLTDEESGGASPSP